MSDVGPWTKYATTNGERTPASASEEQGPWTKFAPGGDAPKRDRDAGIYARFLSGLASDDQERIRMLADRLFPSEPLEESIRRFSKHGGKFVYRSDDGYLYDAMPEGGMRGLLGDLAEGLSKHSPIVAGATAGMATMPAATTGVGLAATMGAAGGAAAAVEVGRQKLGDYLMGRASTKDINVPQVIRETVESGFGQGVGVAFNALATRGAVRDIAKFDPIKTRQAYDDAARVGVDLTPAEATGLPTLAAQQKRLTNITATADEMREFLKARDGQVLTAWGRFLDDISGAADGEDVGRLARETAKNVLTDMRKKLSAEAAPYYEKAYAAKIPFTAEMREFTERPTVQKGLERAMQMMEDEGVESTLRVIQKNPKTGRFEAVAAPDQRVWDYIKRGLDDFINSGEAINEKTGGPNNLGRIAMKQKGILLDFFDNPKSPAYNPAYKQAREIYSDGAEDITTAMQSAIRIIADVKDTNVLSAARHVFDPATRSPQMVRTIRGAIEGKDPEAWQALKRLYVQDVTVSALRATELGEVANPAGKIAKAFSSPKVQANLRAAMDPNEWQAFQELTAVFRRAASVPALRSDTAFNSAQLQEDLRKAQPLLAKVVGGAKALNPANQNFLGLQSLQEFMTNRNLDKQASEVVKAVTSGDPDAIKVMRELRQVSPGSAKGLLLLGHLLSRGGTAAAEEALLGSNGSPDK